MKDSKQEERLQKHQSTAFVQNSFEIFSISCAVLQITDIVWKINVNQKD